MLPGPAPAFGAVRRIRLSRLGTVLVTVGLALGLLAGCGGGDGGKQMASGSAGHGPRGGRGGSGGSGDSTGSGGTGLDGGPAGSGGGPAHQAGGESWTILVYMAADNNLEPFAVQDLTEMASVGSTDKVQIVVQLDRSTGYSNQPIAGLANFTGAKRILVHKGALEVVDTLGTVDSGSATTLQRFISWGMQQYPADRTALVLWDHGGGWAGFAVDESVGSIINAPAIKSAIAQGTAGARLALVAFDACLMGTFEIASMLKPYAEYLLASEEVVPGHGLDYGALAGLAADPTMAPPELAHQLIDGFVAHSIANRDQATITMGLIDLYALGPVEASLRALATAGGMPLPPAKATQAGRARAKARSFGDQAQVPGVMIDVVDFASILAAGDAGYANASAAIAAAVSGAVLYEKHGASRVGAHGMSVYFPTQLHDADPGYEQIMEVAAWRAFLYAYLGIANNGTVAAPAFTNPDNEGVGQIIDGSFVVTGTLAPGSSAVINKATLYYGIYDATTSTLYILGITPAVFDTTTVQGKWDLGILRLDQGAAAEYGFLSVEYTPDGGVSLTIPFVYRSSAADVNGQDAFRVLAFDAALNPLQDSYFVQSGDVLGALTVGPGSTLTSTILISDAAGQSWQETTTAFDAATAIVPSLEQVQTGQVVFGLLLVENIQEESSYVVAVANAP
jgi:hypothetical protein